MQNTGALEELLSQIPKIQEATQHSTVYLFVPIFHSVALTFGLNLSKFKLFPFAE